MDKMHEYLNSLHNILTRTEVTDANRERVDTTTAIDKIIAMLEAVRDARAKNIFIGNGGSAAIASHMAIDYSKNGRLPSLAFNDGAALTCLGNDLGFEKARMNACGYSLGNTFSPNWMDWPMLYTNNPYVIQPGNIFFMHMILMDSENQLAMNLGETYLVTGDGNERLGKQKLDLVVL